MPASSRQSASRIDRDRQAAGGQDGERRFPHWTWGAVRRRRGWLQRHQLQWRCRAQAPRPARVRGGGRNHAASGSNYGFGLGNRSASMSPSTGRTPISRTAPDRDGRLAAHQSRFEVSTAPCSSGVRARSGPGLLIASLDPKSFARGGRPPPWSSPGPATNACNHSDAHCASHRSPSWPPYACSSAASYRIVDGPVSSSARHALDSMCVADDPRNIR